MPIIGTLNELEAIYGQPGETSTVKEVAHITPHYRAFIEAAPFVSLATSGPEGLDCSPRGDLPGFVRVHDEKTLMLPDRRGNNRVDSLRNIVRDPRVALLFMIPGSGNTLRVNGRAHISTEADLLASFVMEGKPPGPSPSSGSMPSIFNVLARFFARICGTRKNTSIRPTFRPRGKSWPGLPKIGSAAKPTTRNGRSGRAKACGEDCTERYCDLRSMVLASA